MPIARFEMPDGKIARFEVPDGTSPEQAQSMFNAQISDIQKQTAPQPKTSASEAFISELANTSSLGFGDNLIAGLTAGGAGVIGGAMRLGGYEGELPSMSEVYNKKKSEILDYQKQAWQEHPYASIGGAVAGALNPANPLNVAGRAINATKTGGKVMQANIPLIKGKKLVNLPIIAGRGIVNVGKGAVGGATGGFIQGVGEGEGSASEILDNAINQAETGAKFGAGGTALIKGVQTAGKYTLGGLAKAALPANKKKAANYAAEELQKITGANRDDVLNALAKADDTVNLRASQITGDVGINSLERELAKNNPKLMGRASQQDIDNLNILQNEYNKLVAQGAPENAIQFIADRANAIIAKLDNAAMQSKSKLDDAINNNVPSATEGEISSKAYDVGLDKLQSFKTGTTQPAWDNVNKETPIAPKNITELQKYNQKNLEAAYSDLPETSLIDKTLSTQKDSAIKAKELIAARSRIEGEIRAEKTATAPNQNKIRLLKQQEQAILKDLQDGFTNGELDNALNATKTQKQLYETGAVGRGLRGKPEEYLGQVVGNQNIKGSLSTKQLLEGQPENKQQVVDYVIKQYAKNIDPEKGVNLLASKRFLRDKADLLNELPEAKKIINDIEKAQTQFTNKAQRQKAITNALQGKVEPLVTGRQKISIASQFINGDAEKSIERIIKSNDKQAGFAIMKMASKDATGQAADGLRSAAVSQLIKGDVLKTFENPKTIATIAQILPKEQIFKIKKLAENKELITRNLKAAGIELTGEQGEFLGNTIARVGSAGLAGKAGVSSLSGKAAVTNLSSKTWQRIVNKNKQASNKIIEDAIFGDNELLKSLLERKITPDGSKVIKGWIFANAPQGEDNNQPAFDTPNNPDGVSPQQEPLTLEITPQSYNTQMQAPRGLRNNNPANLKGNDLWLGKTGVDEGGFIQFKTPQAGLRAMAINLANQEKKHGINTVSGLISKYAPNSENDTVSYIEKVANDLGVKPNQKIKLTDKKTMLKLMKTMITVENGNQPYSNQELLQAINAGISK